MSTYVISKDFAFSAAHHLDGLPSTHQCARPHGHNYLVRVRLEAHHLDAVGFVVDYAQLADFGQWLDATVDHRDLNGVTPAHVGNPTAEHLAAWFREVVHGLCALPAGVFVSVGVSETPKTWAWCHP